MSIYKRILLPVFFSIDLGIALITYYLIVLHRFNFIWPSEIKPSYILLGFIVGISSILSIVVFQTYKEKRGKSLAKGIWEVIKAEALSIILILMFLFSLKDYSYSRLVIGRYIVFSSLLTVLWHLVRYSLLKSYRRRGFNFRRMLLIGEGKIAEQIFNYANNHPENGFKIEGYINKKNLSGVDFSNIEHDLITYYSEKFFIDDIICTIPLPSSLDLEKVILEADNVGARVRLASDYLVSIRSKYKLPMLDGIPLMDVRHEPLRSELNKFLKRAFDILFSLTIIVLLFPLIIPIISLLVVITTGTKPFFIQERVGFSGKIFKCIKFQTMKKNESQTNNATSDKDHPQITESNLDPRITPIGKFLRKYNLDEIPQFFNVLSGQMSVVGPRPHMVSEDKQITQLIQRYKVRQYIKPGITGWAAIKGLRGGTSNLDLMQKRIDHDIWYLENWSPWLDVKISAITFWNLVRRKNMGH